MNNRTNIDYQTRKPTAALNDFVESFWMLANTSNTAQELVVLPDGRVDVFFLPSAQQPFQPLLLGLDMQPSPATLPPQTTLFAISFNLLAVEYLLNVKLPAFNNTALLLPGGFLSITANDLADFDRFCQAASAALPAMVKAGIDERKRSLFRLMYACNGSVGVQELSAKVFWSTRQMNRYFGQRFGLSPKTYCNILRFRASFGHLAKGKLFPEGEFADQAHFIREVKRYAGVVPKELHRNQNGRFIQFSTLQPG